MVLRSSPVSDVYQSCFRKPLQKLARTDTTEAVCATIDYTVRRICSQTLTRSSAPAVSDSVLAEKEVNAEPEAVVATEVNAELEQIFSMPNGYSLIQNDFFPNGYMVPTAQVCPHPVYVWVCGCVCVCVCSSGCVCVYMYVCVCVRM